MLFLMGMVLGFEVGFMLARQALYHLSTPLALWTYFKCYVFLSVCLSVCLSLWHWGLNSELHACQAGILSLEHTSNPFCSGYLFGDWVLGTICPGWP
jgi:hypothetical protein